nr:reverse transcriptase [Tanacetum cinerariifolium]
MKGVEFNEYCAVPPPPAQVYSPHKKDLSWMGLPEFVDDTVTDYTRPTPSIDVSKSASVDESMLWHKRLGHLNFKTINKLVRSNPVKGLPSKSFENNHSCIACLKGKQHKASFVVIETSSTNISCIKEDVHQAVKEKESPLRFIALPNWLHEAQMATLNEAAKKDDAIPDNNSPQKEQQEVNEEKEVPESSRNSNPTASLKVSTNDSSKLASSSTVETKFPLLVYLFNLIAYLYLRLEDFFEDTSKTVSLNEVKDDLSNMETAIQPPGFQDLEFSYRVYKVEKAMYGLHQAPKAWYGTLSKYLLDNGFQSGTIDQTLFVRKHKREFLLVQGRITRGTIRISQSKVPSPGAYETSFPTGDVRYGEAFPTDTSLDAGQDKENIFKTSAMPHEALLRVTSFGVATASTCISLAIATASGSFPTAAFFTTSCVATPTTRVTRSSRGVVIRSSSLMSVNIPSISKKDKGKGKMSKPEQPNQIIREQAERDYEIAKIHAERELEMMIAELDRSNEMIAKYLSEYDQAAVGLSHDEKIEEKLIPVWEKMQDFVPMNSKQESKRLKRPGIQLDKERIKKLKTAKALGQRKCWKIIRVGNHTEVYQMFEDMLKKFNKEDLDKLWSLVKETCNTIEVINEKQRSFRLSVPTTDVYIAKKLATIEDFALLHEDKIYSKSKTRICYI